MTTPIPQLPFAGKAKPVLDLEEAQKAAEAAWLKFEKARNAAATNMTPETLAAGEAAGREYDAAAAKVKAAEREWTVYVMQAAGGKSLAGDPRTLTRQGWRSEVTKALEPGIKAVVGSVSVPSPTDVVAPPHAEARFLVELLPMAPTAQGRSFEYLRVGTVTYGAGTVAELGTKPESDPAITRVESKVTTIATLVDSIPRQVRDDHADLESVVDSVMRIAVLRTLEDQVLNGDGTGINLLGVYNTAGIQSQTKGADPWIDAILKAMTKVRVTEGVPWLVGINPTDWQTVILTKDANGQHVTVGPGQALPIDRAEQRLWGVPVVVSTQVPAGNPIVLGEGAVEVVTREDFTLDWNEGGDPFRRNELVFRGEGRWGVAVRRPGHVCEIV